MKSVLKALFDYQKFEQNKDLSAVIADTDQRYMGKNGPGKIIPLSDELLNLAAAGTGIPDWKKPGEENTNNDNGSHLNQ
ncbi:MAG: hypothetical protein K5770_04100 [Lachnospiraceae bacterium]|nr:hypothetical protein [Lachnospiraceae bacterium]